MRLDRRDFMKASAALGGAMTLKSTGLLPQAMAATGPDAPPVIWLQGQSCTGCSVSFLNSIYYTTADDLLLNQLDVRFQSNVMAAAGDLAVDAAVSTPAGYVLILEGSIPFGANGEYCHLWENTSMVDALQQFSPNAGVIIALGTCACYGGMYAATPNPTDTLGVQDALSRLGINKSVINIPGCPAHPDWLVGTVATLLNGAVPTLDSHGRPVQYYPKEEIHEDCPFHEEWDEVDQLGQVGCLEHLGCKGKVTHADCHYRKWNSGAPGEYGEEWCIGAGSPCIGCTEPSFPDGMSPFYAEGGSDDDDHHDDDHDTLTINKVEYRLGSRELYIEATSTLQPEAILTLSGYGQMTWLSNQNIYQFRKTGIDQPSGNITVSSSLGGSVTSSVDIIGTTNDTVSISKATFDSRRGQLTVEATSSGQPNAILNIAGYGNMRWNSRRNYYYYRQRGVADPGGTVTVTSSLGGSDTATLTSRRAKRT